MSALDDLLAAPPTPGVHRCAAAYDVACVRESAVGAGWRFAHLDAVDSVDALHTALATALDFPSYYGRNLDALHDCLRDVSPATLVLWDDWWELARRAPQAFGSVVDMVGDSITVLLRGDDVGQDVGPGAVVSWLG